MLARTHSEDATLDATGFRLAANAARITRIYHSLILNESFRPIVLEVFGRLPLGLQIALFMHPLTIELEPRWDRVRPITVEYPAAVAGRSGFEIPIDLSANGVPVMEGTVTVIDTRTPLAGEAPGRDSLLALTMGVLRISARGVHDPDCQVTVELVAATR
ncbi:MAG: hypothetical protein L0Z55_00745 [Planctomycetes bacterium]|nr:hypothetical protein [Planctomycetota bacterium]